MNIHILGNISVQIPVSLIYRAFEVVQRVVIVWWCRNYAN